MFRIAWVAVALGCVFSVGCGGSKSPVGEAANKDALAEVGEVLKSLADEGKKPPTKLAELGPIEPMLPRAAPLIRSGDLVYVWGTAYAANGDKVAAYEKKVPAEGGLVLLQNNTIKEMTAAEFAAAPKAK